MTKARKPQVWVVFTGKGGSRKTTTAMFTSFQLVKLGYQPLGIDADPASQGMTAWTGKIYLNDQEPTFDVAQWPGAGQVHLIKFTKEKMAEFNPDITIMDVGGEALQTYKTLEPLADLVISPFGAEEAEIEGLERTKGLVSPNKKHVALLTKVPHQGLVWRTGEDGSKKKVEVGAVKEAREFARSLGIHVLDGVTTNVPNDYAAAWGRVPESTFGYAPIAYELLRYSGMDA